MAELPEPPTPTLAAIWASYEADQSSGFRDHLGASLIGTECRRAIWYSWRWATEKKFSGRILRLFQTGHLQEPRMVADLRATGADVQEVDPTTGLQWTVRDESGHFGGSMDAVAIGVLEAPKTWHVCEFKTHSSKSFTSLQTKGVKEAKPEHWAQMQVYMHLGGLERAVYLAVNKNDDDLHAERVNYDAAAGKALVEKAHAVIGSPQPPERASADPHWFLCKFCDHRGVCWEGARPAPHCRSCLHSTPVEAGAWHCAAHADLIPSEAQRQGCGRHLFIPGLVDGQQIDADPSGEWVEYRMADGTTWRDGVPF